jgi:hypothetical protein
VFRHGQPAQKLSSNFRMHFGPFLDPASNLKEQKKKWKDELREIVRSRHGEGVWMRLKAEHLLQVQLLTKRFCRSTRDFDLFAAAELYFETITEPGDEAGNISKIEESHPAYPFGCRGRRLRDRVARSDPALLGR